MLEKILKLWENCYLIILFIHILKLEISGCDIDGPTIGVHVELDMIFLIILYFSCEIFLSKLYETNEKADLLYSNIHSSL
jgi:hypothetical protein